MTHFNDLNLAAPLLKTLEALGYETPTPIQSQSIPILLDGKDLLGIAQTGTGKTASFALPLLHHLNASQKDGERPRKSVRGLVLAPTRELASQIGNSFRDYGKNLGLRCNVIMGGVPIQKQVRALEKGTDVLIATPGRLEDLMRQKAVTLDFVTHLVLDEADQMMDMGFIHVLKRIERALPKDRQTLLFSATMPPEIEALAQQFLDTPEKVSVAPASSTAERVTQSAHFVKQKDKAVLLSRLLKGRDVTRAIIFTRTKHGANRLVGQLDKAGLDSVAIHGNKTQNQRQRALNSFKNGECIFLVATDVAARGIDIPEVSHVFNFDLPEVPEQYVHRIGRTARAGREGEAVSLISDGERKLLRQIERLTKVELDVLPLPEGFTQDLKDAPADMNQSPRDRRKAEFSEARDSRDGARNSRGKGPRQGQKRRSDSPRQDGPRGEGRRQDSQAYEGGRRDGPRGEGRRNDGPRGEGRRNDGPRGEGRRNDGPRGEGRRHDGPRGEGRRHDGPRGEGRRNDGPRGEGRRHDGPRGEGRRHEGPRGERNDRPQRSHKPGGKSGGFKSRSGKRPEGGQSRRREHV